MVTHTANILSISLLQVLLAARFLVWFLSNPVWGSTLIQGIMSWNPFSLVRCIEITLIEYDTNCTTWDTITGEGRNCAPTGLSFLQQTKFLREGRANALRASPLYSTVDGYRQGVFWLVGKKKIKNSYWPMSEEGKKYRYTEDASFFLNLPWVVFFFFFSCRAWFQLIRGVVKRRI